MWAFQTWACSSSLPSPARTEENIPSILHLVKRPFVSVFGAQLPSLLSEIAGESIENPNQPAQLPSFLLEPGERIEDLEKREFFQPSTPPKFGLRFFGPKIETPVGTLPIAQPARPKEASKEVPITTEPLKPQPQKLKPKPRVELDAEIHEMLLDLKESLKLPSLSHVVEYLINGLDIICFPSSSFLNHLTCLVAIGFQM